MASCFGLLLVGSPALPPSPPPSPWLLSPVVEAAAPSDGEFADLPPPSSSLS